MKSDINNLLSRVFYDFHFIVLVQGDPTNFRWDAALVKISTFREIRILKFFVKNIRQIEVRSAMLS